jgi:2-iminobutanoate/2-iminopropanoate deaminase
MSIFTPDAPAPIGPYSQAVRAGTLLFCSGQIPLDPATGKLVDGDVAAQTRRVLDNIAALLTAAGTSYDRVVKTTIYLVDMADFTTVNPIYGERFGASPPARSTIAVAALPLGARIEIEVIASV